MLLARIKDMKLLCMATGKMIINSISGRYYQFKNKRRITKIKKLTIITMYAALLITLFTGCGFAQISSDNGVNTTNRQIPDLAGEWKQTNSEAKDSYQTATISGNRIEIYWVNDNGDAKSLYWAGSYVAPTTADEPYSWTSKNDHSKTESALLASSDDTKTMTYQSGVLSYEASAMGTTRTVKLKKQQ